MRPTITLYPSNIIGDGNDIMLNVSAKLISDVKDTYGIDLENKKLLMHLKKFGSLTILASTTQELLGACQTEEELDAEDAQELAAAKAGMAIAEARLGDKSKYANILNMQ